jgi:hypothetical protein
MAKIRIEVYEDGTRSATITVPAWVVRGAVRLLPNIAGKSLREHADIEQVVELAKDPQANGVIIEIEDHKDNERVLISIVAEEGPTLQA